MQLQRPPRHLHQRFPLNNLPLDQLAEEDLLAVALHRVRTLPLPLHNPDKIVSILDRVVLLLLEPVLVLAPAALVDPGALVNDLPHHNSTLLNKA